MTTASAAGTKTKALCVATPCISVDQFVATFHKYCDESTIFVATLASRPVGLETAFSIELADRTPVLQGLCEIVDAWGTPANPFGRPGIRLQIRRLTRPSVDVFQRLRARRVAELRGTAGTPAAKIAPPPTAGMPKIPLPKTPPGATERAPSEPVPENVPRTPSASSGVPIELPAIAVHAPGSPAAVSTNPYPFIAKVAPAWNDGAPELKEEPPEPPTPPPPPPKPAAPKLPSWATARAMPPKPITTIMPPGRNAAAAAAESSPESEIPTVVRDATQAALDADTAVRDAPPSVVAKSRPSASEIAREAAETAAAKLRAMAAESLARTSTIDAPAGAPPPLPPPPEPEVTIETKAPAFPEPPTPPPPPPPANEDPQVRRRRTTDAALAGLAAMEPRPLDIAAPLAEGERVPGSELVLPANPLMNLTDSSLQGFVDCTLYEETGNFFAAPEGEGGGDHDPTAAPPVSRTPSLIGIENLEAISEPLKLEPPPGARAESAPQAVQGGFDSKPIAKERPREDDDVAVIVAPAVVAEGGVTRSSRPSLPPGIAGAVTTPQPATPSRRRWWPIGAGAAAVVGVVGGVIVVLAQGSSASNNDKPPPPPPQAAVTIDASPAPPVAQPGSGSDEEPPPPPPATGEPPVVGSGPCRVTVLSTPAGSTVSVDGKPVGPSPLSIDGPCAKKQIDIVHGRYAAVQKFVEPAAGKPEKIEVTLERPTHAVLIVTQPPGAKISLNGQRAGVSPTVVNVMGFESMRLTADKPGFKTKTVTLYSRVPRDRMTIALDRSLFPPKSP